MPAVVVVAKPLTVNAPEAAKAPEAKVPVVVRFSLPKLMAPVSEFITANLTVPVDEAVAKEISVVALIAPVTAKAPEAKVPVVVRFSLPKLMAPVSELMVADFNTAAPVVEAEPAKARVLDKLTAPVTPKVPPMVVLPLVSSTINLLVSMTIPFTVDVAVRVEVPVTDKVPAVLILLPIVVAAPTKPAVASVATIEATITCKNSFELISFFIVFDCLV